VTAPPSLSALRFDPQPEFRPPLNARFVPLHAVKNLLSVALSYLDHLALWKPALTAVWIATCYRSMTERPQGLAHPRQRLSRDTTSRMNPPCLLVYQVFSRRETSESYLPVTALAAYRDCSDEGGLKIQEIDVEVQRTKLGLDLSHSCPRLFPSQFFFRRTKDI